MMSSNVALLHSNNCCVLEPAICEDLDLHVVILVVVFLVEELILYVEISWSCWIACGNTVVLVEWMWKHHCILYSKID